MFQVIKAKCCGIFFAACSLYDDKEWQKDVIKYIIQGHSLEEVSKEEIKSNFGRCMCHEKQIEEKKEIHNPNQLSIFND